MFTAGAALGLAGLQTAGRPAVGAAGTRGEGLGEQRARGRRRAVYGEGAVRPKATPWCSPEG